MFRVRFAAELREKPHSNSIGITIFSDSRLEGNLTHPIVVSLLRGSSILLLSRVRTLGTKPGALEEVKTPMASLLQTEFLVLVVICVAAALYLISTFHKL